jgi:cyclopropane fatty-acyl-phospholipid synthase-like methyltransferase
MGKSQKVSYEENQAEKVKAFYNATTDKFLAVYGEIIQAYRTKNVDEYLEYTAKNMLLEGEMKVLDAGCGVAGPAVFFAKKYPAMHIDACSISEVQIEKAKQKIKENELTSRVSANVGDYHELNQNYEINSYDRVYFLESFGHSSNKKRLLHGVWDVLSPGGMVYIKDLFKREVEEEWEQHYIDKICQDIDKAYEYHIGTLYETLSILRKKGFILKFIKTPNVPLDEFEHLSISNEFQNLFDIGKIDSWEDYVFPIDFFEILAEKPIIPSEEDRHLYFLNKL